MYEIEVSWESWWDGFNSFVLLRLRGSLDFARDDVKVCRHFDQAHPWRHFDQAPPWRHFDQVQRVEKFPNLRYEQR